MFGSHPFRDVIGRRVIVHLTGGDTWRGTLVAYRDEWLTLTGAQYVDEHGTMGADGDIMLPECGIEWMQVTDSGEEVAS